MCALDPDQFTGRPILSANLSQSVNTENIEYGWKFKLLKGNEMGELPSNYVMNVDDEYFVHQGALCNFPVGNTPVWNEANTTTSRAEHIKVNK